MENKIKGDYLNLKIDSNLNKIIGNEEILFTDKIKKINKFGFTQERNIIITSQAIYNFKKKGKIIIILFGQFILEHINYSYFKKLF